MPNKKTDPSKNERESIVKASFHAKRAIKPQVRGLRLYVGVLTWR